LRCDKLEPHRADDAAGFRQRLRQAVQLDFKPIWKLTSGAWFRQSTREYPIYRRALSILNELCHDQ